MSTYPILPEHEESKEPPTNPEDPSISKATATAFEKENNIITQRLGEDTKAEHVETVPPIRTGKELSEAEIALMKTLIASETAEAYGDSSGKARANSIAEGL